MAKGCTGIARSSSRATSIRALTSLDDRPRGGEQVDLGGGILSPGFVDWQINGGGGVLFNANPSR